MLQPLLMPLHENKSSLIVDLFIFSEFDDSGFMECYTENIDVLEASNIMKTPERPTTGKKRPRANHLAVGTNAKKCPKRQVVQPECARCRHLLAENRELRETNALLTEQLMLKGWKYNQVKPPHLGKYLRRLLKDIK